ncbi:hypothetical protein H0H93_010894 [Arthromyces matolae]|nr:hypothetical protein H0H93_010894 [Arthromyces matolae]
MSKYQIMGRRAKYFTLADKAIAVNQQRLEYSQTSRYRFLRRSQNQRFYAKGKEMRASASTVPPSLQVPDLPSELYELSEFGLPASMRFKDAFRSNEWYADSDEYNDSVLSAWDSPPPYLSPPPENCENFQEVLLAYRLRKRKEVEIARLDKYRSNPLRDFSSDVYQELMVCYNEWEQLRTEIKNMGEGLEMKFSLGIFVNRWNAIR